MTHDTFYKLVDQRIAKINSVLRRKADDYATDRDRLHSFKASPGIVRGKMPEEVLISDLDKHLCSIYDIVDDLRPIPGGRGPRVDRLPNMDEKIGDAINYLILLEGLIAERMQEYGMVPPPGPTAAPPAWPNLAESTDATVWAKEFVRTFSGRSIGNDVDEGTMIGWFANAMCAVRDQLTRDVASPCPPDLVREDVLDVYDQIIEDHMRKSFPFEIPANVADKNGPAVSCPESRHQRLLREAREAMQWEQEMMLIRTWHPVEKLKHRDEDREDRMEAVANGIGTL